MFRLKRLLVEDPGQNMVEYGLLAAFISIVAIVALKGIAPQVFFIFARLHHVVQFTVRFF